MSIGLCIANERHSLIVTRWAKNEKVEIADLLICQHCCEIFEWEYLVAKHYGIKMNSGTSVVHSSLAE
jgi:hypothetical protein